MSNQNQRKVLLINPRFQLAFLAYTVGVSALTALIFYGAVYYFFWRFKALGLSIGLPQDHVFFQFIAQQRTLLDLCWIIVSFLAIIVICASGILLSHRVAGPLHKLQQHMLKVASGETESEVKFRDKDFFPELAEAYNAQLKRFVSKKD